jgi:hypothetical protein
MLVALPSSACARTAIRLASSAETIRVIGAVLLSATATAETGA